MTKKIGAVIAAANRNLAEPTKIMGSISILKRVVATLKKAEVDRIVVVTGFDENTIKSLLQAEDVVFLYNDDYEDPPLLSSLNIGFKYLSKKVDRILAVPVNVPMFTFETCVRIMNTPGKIVIPSYEHHGGHPTLISSEFAEAIDEYEKQGGEEGLRGFLRRHESEKVFLPVDDPGTYYSIHQEKRLKSFLQEHNETLMRPEISLSIFKEQVLFDKRGKLLLSLIDEFHSVNGACQKMSLSLSKAWQILNHLEEELGFSVVIRKHGGSKGGTTKLSKEGRAFLEKYEELEDRILKYANVEFNRLFKEKEQK